MARLAVFINVISLTPRPLKQTQSTDETFESVRLKSNASIKLKSAPLHTTENLRAIQAG